ncbi:MurR/RpiR family transcriptional regulator [Rhodococcus jostii]|nr:MurR/RpiR family transcriptional regulator [Rhodococcus jostii]
MRSISSDPPVGSTLSAIRASAPSLTPSERRVADVCVEQSRAVAWWSVAELAEHAGTSTATVTRACQRLGFSGFQHLRTLLVRELGAATVPLIDPSSGCRDGAGDLQAAFAEMATDVAGALAPLDDGAFDRAVRVLASADRILVIGNGGSGASAAAMAVHFVLNGRTAVAPTDAVIQQMTAAHLTSRDVCLVVGDSGTDSATLGPAESARAAGATVVGVARSPLVELSDISLVIGRGTGCPDELGRSATVVQFAFLITLQIAVCRDGLRR